VLKCEGLKLCAQDCLAGTGGQLTRGIFMTHFCACKLWC